jgi:uncharacterized iron-regulated membrane protein
LFGETPSFLRKTPRFRRTTGAPKPIYRQFNVPPGTTSLLHTWPPSLCNLLRKIFVRCGKASEICGFFSRLISLALKQSYKIFRHNSPTIFSLHRWLLLDKIEKPIFGELDNRKLGGYITGVSAILFTIGVLSGIALWVPRKIKSWKQGFKIKTSGSWKRTNQDLHNTLGFYACIFLFCMGSTGPQWGFDWYRTGLRKMLGTYAQEKDEKEKKGPQSVVPKEEIEKPLIADYLHAASQVLDYPGDYLLNLPADSAAALNISKTKIGFFAPAAADRIVMDQYTAKVIKTERFADLPFNQRVSGSIKAIHTGELYGMFTKIIYFFACLIATSLPVTGTMIWMNKMKKSKSKKAIPATKRLEPAVI